MDLLDNPYLFNIIRSLLAGDQRNTKQFVFEKILKYKCKTVLDLGCGTGDFSLACPPDTDYLGSDINQKYITFAKERFKNDNRKTFIVSNLFHNEMKTSYDAVLFISMMHHFSDEELNIILKNTKKVTKKICIVADIIPDPPWMIQKIIAKLDRGKYVRTKEEKMKIISRSLTIKETRIIKSRFAVQFGILCVP